MEICQKCLITLSFSLKEIPNSLEFKKVSNKKNNIILVEIMAHHIKFAPNYKFIITVDGSRYGIHIISMNMKKVYLKQYFLHYNSVNLVPVSVRFVKIYYLI